MGPFIGVLLLVLFGVFRLVAIPADTPQGAEAAAIFDDVAQQILESREQRPDQ